MSGYHSFPKLTAGFNSQRRNVVQTKINRAKEKMKIEFFVEIKYFEPEKCLNCIQHLLTQIPYTEVTHETSQLPKRVFNTAYERQTLPEELYIPQVF